MKIYFNPKYHIDSQDVDESSDGTLYTSSLHSDKETFLGTCIDWVTDDANGDRSEFHITQQYKEGKLYKTVETYFKTGELESVVEWIKYSDQWYSDGVKERYDPLSGRFLERTTYKKGKIIEQILRNDVTNQVKKDLSIKSYEEKEKELLEELETKFRRPIFTTKEVSTFGWELYSELPIKKKYARKPFSGLVVFLAHGWGGPTLSERFIVEEGVVKTAEKYSKDKLFEKIDEIDLQKLNLPDIGVPDSKRMWKVEKYYQNGSTLSHKYHTRGECYLRSEKFGFMEEYNLNGSLKRKDLIAQYSSLIKKKDGLYYEENSNKPFTGICDGEWIGRMNHGKKEGYWYPLDHEYAELYKEGKLIKSPDDDSWGYWEEQEGLGNPADPFK